MTPDLRERALGLGVVALALFLLLVAVPQGVVRPKSVANIVLSPDFWPQILAWLLLAIGVWLSATAFLRPQPAADAAGPPDERAARAPAGEPGDTPRDGADPRRGEWWRLAAFAGLLVLLAIGIPTVGMVWASAAAFWVLVLVTRQSRPWAALAVGIILPLLLYAFFSKFAGVPIPQGDLVRLP